MENPPMQAVAPWKRIAGLTGGVLMIGCGAVHSLLGWPQMKEDLAKAGVPITFAEGFVVPWHFAGLSMATFGVLVILALHRSGVDAAPRRPFLRTVGGMWVFFAMMGTAFIRVDSTFLVFLIPGLLALVPTV
jgi:hypothetical protein